MKNFNKISETSNIFENEWNGQQHLGDEQIKAPLFHKTISQVVVGGLNLVLPKLFFIIIQRISSGIYSKLTVVRALIPTTVNAS